MDIIRNIYSWFRDIYGTELYDYLKGVDCNGAFIGPNHFITIGLITIAIAFVISCLFYFVRHAKFNHFLSWLIILCVVGAINLLFGYGFTYNEYQGNMPDYVIYGMENVTNPTDDNGDPIECETCECMIPVANAIQKVSTDTCWKFGLANMLIAIMFFLVFSIILKRFSKDCQHTPWKSLFP